MQPGSLIKQPWERRNLSIDATGILPQSVTITTVEAKMYDPDDVDMSTTMVISATNNSGVLTVIIAGGTHRVTYNLRIRLTLSNSEQIEDDIAIKVRERRS